MARKLLSGTRRISKVFSKVKFDFLVERVDRLSSQVMLLYYGRAKERLHAKESVTIDEASRTASFDNYELSAAMILFVYA